jgi:hypothetical protein
MIDAEENRMRSTIAAFMTAAVLVVCAPGSARPGNAQPAASDATHSPGIWKAAVPPNPMKGEFDNLDPLGVAAGVRIKADCSLNWIDPDDGARYCFSSGTSLEYFLDHPQASIANARRGWQKLGAQSSSRAE